MPPKMAKILKKTTDSPQKTKGRKPTAKDGDGSPTAVRKSKPGKQKANKAAAVQREYLHSAPRAQAQANEPSG